mgnify:CR=1 FL=1
MFNGSTWGNVPPGAGNHVNRPANVKRLEVVFRILLRVQSCSGKQHDENRSLDHDVAYFVDACVCCTDIMLFSLRQYSGYIVSAPPRLASNGIL